MSRHEGLDVPVVWLDGDKCIIDTGTKKYIIQDGSGIYDMLMQVFDDMQALVDENDSLHGKIADLEDRILTLEGEQEWL